MTETTGGATRTVGPDESARHGSVGRLAENMEAKIVDPVTGNALGPGQRGELWLRGPTIMKGNAFILCFLASNGSILAQYHVGGMSFLFFCGGQMGLKNI